MALTCDELTTSRFSVFGKDSQKGSLEYFLKGSTSVADIEVKVRLTSPDTFPGEPKLVRGDITTRPIGGGCWLSTVEYVPDYAPILPAVGGPGPALPVPALPGQNDVLGADFAFDLTGQAEHITQSLQTISSTTRTGFPALPDLKGVIGLNADGEVQGCDRIRPYLEWSVSRTFESVTFAYVNTLSKLVGKTNNAVFAGFGIGTTLFIGATGNTKDGEKSVVTFKFITQEDKVNIDICTGLQVPSKKAWEYLWVSYKNVENGLHLTQQPTGAYVEKIYESGDFSLMRIGV